MLLLGARPAQLAGAIVQTIFLLAIFVPFSYVMDRLVWRSHEKRLEKTKRADAEPCATRCGRARGPVASRAAYAGVSPSR